jgi:hypothetical protein
MNRKIKLIVMEQFGTKDKYFKKEEKLQIHNKK